MSSSLLALLGLGAGEVILIVIVIVLLFGATKIPQVMRGMGQGIGEFKKGLRDGNEEDKSKEAKTDPKVESIPAPQPDAKK